MTSDEFAKLAAVEDSMWYFQALHRHLHRETQALHAGARELALLDAGCGTGGWLRRLEQWEPAWQAQGLDASAEAVAWAKSKGGTRCVQGTLEAPPFAEGQFDAVTCADVLYMVEDVDKALQGLARCLRPGGSLVVTAPAYRWLRGYHDEAVGGRRRFVKAELQESLLRAGLQPRQATYWNAVTFPLIVLRRKVFRPDPAKGDVALGHPAVECGLRQAMRLETAWLRAGGRWPWGGNLLLSAQKL